MSSVNQKFKEMLSLAYNDETVPWHETSPTGFESYLSRYEKDVIIEAQIKDCDDVISEKFDWLMKVHMGPADKALVYEKTGYMARQRLVLTAVKAKKAELKATLNRMDLEDYRRLNKRTWKDDPFKLVPFDCEVPPGSLALVYPKGHKFNPIVLDD